MTLLTVIPFWADDAARAEQLLDFIFRQNEREALNGHVLLVIHPSTDKEMRERIQISAELAFVSAAKLELVPLKDDRAPKWENVNNAFSQAAKHIAGHYRVPWLWMEPDCTPTRRGWLWELCAAYDNQPRHYFGTRMKTMVGKQELFFMARNGINPVNAAADMVPAAAPLEFSSAPQIFPKLTPANLLPDCPIQQLVIHGEEEAAKVRPATALVHGDKAGFLMRWLEAREAAAVEIKEAVQIEAVPMPAPRKAGRPRKPVEAVLNGH